MATKTFVRGASAIEPDLFAAETEAPDDASRGCAEKFRAVRTRLKWLRQPQNLMAVVYSRFQHLEQLTPLALRFAQALSRPYLTAWHPMANLPHPALVRTLSGHTHRVNGCAISPDGSFIVSASWDKTLKVWDAKTGARL
ncbi:MAG: hypothetical protein JO232_03090 [Verrucomicrobia bacterium]|nr:hypothetical protein [Verrucomicrobiota bacterium]